MEFFSKNMEFDLKSIDFVLKSEDSDLKFHNVRKISDLKCARFRP